jgi:hypothetical protein
VKAEALALVEAIAEAARELVVKRDAWLNPPNASAEELKRRTLTNLYNARPSWLAEAHRKLDAAVFAAYGWPVTLTDAELLERLLTMNHQRAGSRQTREGSFLLSVKIYQLVPKHLFLDICRTRQVEMFDIDHRSLRSYFNDFKYP